MATKDRSLFSRVGRWRSLVDNAQEFLPEVPQIEGDLRELGDLSEEVVALRAERMVQERKLREITARIRTLGKRGDNIRGRIGASLKGRFGFDSSLLIQFGFTPRKTVASREPALSPPSRDGTR